MGKEKNQQRSPSLANDFQNADFSKQKRALGQATG